MALNESTQLERIQLDISPTAKLNLKLYAALTKSKSMSEALDRILTKYMSSLAVLSGESPDVFKDGA